MSAPKFDIVIVGNKIAFNYEAMDLLREYFYHRDILVKDSKAINNLISVGMIGGKRLLGDLPASVAHRCMSVTPYNDRMLEDNIGRILSQVRVEDKYKELDEIFKDLVPLSTKRSMEDTWWILRSKTYKNWFISPESVTGGVMKIRDARRFATEECAQTWLEKSNVKDYIPTETDGVKLDCWETWPSSEPPPEIFVLESVLHELVFIRSPYAPDDESSPYVNDIRCTYRKENAMLFYTKEQCENFCVANKTGIFEPKPLSHC